MEAACCPQTVALVCAMFAPKQKNKKKENIMSSQSWWNQHGLYNLEPELKTQFIWFQNANFKG